MIVGAFVLLAIVFLGVLTCKLGKKTTVVRRPGGECEGNCGACYRCGI